MQLSSSVPVLDLTRRAFHKTRGDLTAVGTWLLIEGEWEPALVIHRTGDERHPHFVPCVVPLRNAHIWYEDFGDPAPAVTSCYRFLRGMRFDLTTGNVHRLLAMVHDHLDDLCRIPPLPPLDDIARRPAFGELTITNADTNQVVHEAELRHD